jgi:hypothetical protein
MELEPMNEATKTAIEALAKKAQEADKPGDAMQFAQAALNLAHVYGLVKNADKQ